MTELLDFNKYASLKMMVTIQYGVPSKNTCEHTCRRGRGNRLAKHVYSYNRVYSALHLPSFSHSCVYRILTVPRICVPL